MSSNLYRITAHGWAGLRAILQKPRKSHFTGIALLFSVSGLSAGSAEAQSLLDSIVKNGELVVVSRVGPATCFNGPSGFAGLEYDLVRLFAQELGVVARFKVLNHIDDILQQIVLGSAHLAAAAIRVTPSRKKLIRFGPSYQEVTQQVVYRGGSRRPREISDLLDKQIEVVAGNGHDDQLKRLGKQYPGLRWQAHREMDSDQLLHCVKEGLIDFTIADSNELALKRRFFPELKPALTLTRPQKLAWALARSKDDSLFGAVSRFFKKIRKSGKLDQLIERYYGHVNSLNFVDKRTFKRHVKKRLPRYIALFKQAAKNSGLDWRLLAAIGYQESHWDPEAVSPTGVKGIMMLTQPTAEQLGVDDRTDPKLSILGGARYVRIVDKKIPERIQQPDRMWLTLAAYNVGFGHLEDARILTQKQGADPDKWADVKQRLPLLSQRRWYETTKRGFARGRF